MQSHAFSSPTTCAVPTNQHRTTQSSTKTVAELAAVLPPPCVRSVYNTPLRPSRHCTPQPPQFRNGEWQEYRQQVQTQFPPLGPPQATPALPSFVTVQHLFEAIRYDDQSHIAGLLKRFTGVIHAKDGYGLSALHFAAMKKRSQIIALLLEYGSDVNARDNMGNTPLILAVWFATPEIIKQLLNHAATSIMQANYQGNTVFHVAEDTTADNLHGQNRIFDILLSRSMRNAALLDAPNSQQWRPLHTAAWGGQMHLCKQLMRYEGVHINAQNKEGNTPLMLAAYRGHDEIVRLLVQALSLSAIETRNQRQQTAMDVAWLRGHASASRILQAAIARKSASSTQVCSRGK